MCFHHDESAHTMMLVGTLAASALICLPFLCYMRRMSDALETIAYGDCEFDDDDDEELCGCCGEAHSL